MKQTTRKRRKAHRTDELDQYRIDDFKWLAEVHKVLSPYWSARFGYQNATY